MVERLPIIEEQAEINLRKVETGRVRISKSVVERNEVVDALLQKEEVDVQRVRVDRPVDAPVATRQEGDLTIVSLHEEVTVVTKQLVVTEELHIRRKTSQTHEPQQITLRREEVRVERDSLPDAAMRPRNGTGDTAGGIEGRA